MVAQEMADDAQRYGKRYQEDVFGSTQNKEGYKTNVITALRRFKESPDVTIVTISPGCLDDICRSSMGKALHCTRPSQIFTDLPPQHTLAKEFDALCKEEDFVYTKGFYAKIQENKAYDPENKTIFLREEDRIMVQTTLGIIRAVLEDTPVSYWKNLAQPVVEELRNLWGKIDTVSFHQKSAS